MTKEEYLLKILQIQRNKPKKLQTSIASNYPQGYFKEKECRHCGSFFIPKAPSEHYCCDFCKDYGVTEAYYKRTYNLTIEEYLDIAERQQFKCAICGKDNFKMAEHHSGVLVVDHDHKTGNVRGLLCHNCNRALGLFQDDMSILSHSIKYLEGATTIRKE